MPAYNHRGRLVPGKMAFELRENEMIYWGEFFPMKVVKVEKSTPKTLIVTVEQNGIQTKKNIRAAAIVGLYIPLKK